MRADALFRIYSMTKPITCVALMTLYEKGGFQLVDPVARFIPAFQDLKVYAGGDGPDIRLVDLARPVTVRDLLTHTSGLTYRWMEHGPVEEMYRRACDWSRMSLVDYVAALIEMPLAFQPGTAWRYSVAHDVVARLVEIISGRPFDVYLWESIFEPLGMDDTGFWVPENQLDRFAAMYGAFDIGDPGVTVIEGYSLAARGVNRLLAGPRDSLQSRPHDVLRGGTGLVSTAADYMRFCQMLLNEGSLAETRVLGRKTVELMLTNHLPVELLPWEIQGAYSPGYGYGLGQRVLMDVGQAQIPGSVGEYGWSGAAGTYFWIDPREAFIGILMAQFQPSHFYPIAPNFRVAAYQAIAD